VLVDRSVAALEAGKGVVFGTGHFGLWDYAPAVLADRYPGRVYIVVEHLNSALLNELVQGQRALQGSTIIPMHNVRAMVRALRGNGIIAVLVDRPVPALRARYPPTEPRSAGSQGCCHTSCSNSVAVSGHNFYSP